MGTVSYTHLTEQHTRADTQQYASNGKITPKRRKDRICRHDKMCIRDSFSRWPILWAEVLRLPEQYNWYYDRQKRIGGRNAVFAKLDVQGPVSYTHLAAWQHSDARTRRQRTGC